MLLRLALDFLLTALAGCTLRAKRFFRKTLQAAPIQEPIWINVDKNVAYPKAMDEVKAEKELPLSVELRQNKYLNNRIEQDHRFIKRLTLAKNGISLVQYSGREH